MTEGNAFENMNIIIALSDRDEEEHVTDIVKEAGAVSVIHCDNTLDMVLCAMKYEDLIIITEDRKSVLDISDALEYITKRSKYVTVSVISDNWSEESREALLGYVDVFLTRPVMPRNLLPSMLVVTARKMHMKDLEREYQEAEESFARDKNMSFAEHVIMDTLGLSKESAGEYIRTLAEKHGFDEGEVSKIVYEVLLAGGKK